MDYLAIAGKIDRLDGTEQTGEAIQLAWATAEQAKQAGDEGYFLFFSGEALCLEGNLAGGVVQLEQAAELLSSEPLVLNTYAIVLSRLGKVRASIKILGQVLDQYPDDALALGQKGVCLSKLGYNDEALSLFEQILGRDPHNVHAQRNRGVALSRVGREKEALACFSEILAENPTDNHAKSEKKILEEELHLKATPLGWLVVWVRKRLAPSLKKAISPLPK